MAERKSLVLASGSRTRQAMLAGAGLTFRAEAADVDEAALRGVLLTENEGIDPGDVAKVLARAKAEAVSRLYPDALVIGADQVLACEGVLFEKPADMEGARQSLLRLRGKAHQLLSAVVLAEDGHIVWTHTQTAELVMRPFSMAFLTEYVARTGSQIMDSVGAYQLEGLGIQLFERIEGDYFTILGLPLLALLGELRARGEVAA